MAEANRKQPRGVGGLAGAVAALLIAGGIGIAVVGHGTSTPVGGPTVSFPAGSTSTTLSPATRQAAAEASAQAAAQAAASSYITNADTICAQLTDGLSVPEAALMNGTVTPDQLISDLNDEKTDIAEGLARLTALAGPAQLRQTLQDHFIGYSQAQLAILSTYLTELQAAFAAGNTDQVLNVANALNDNPVLNADHTADDDALANAGFVACAQTDEDVPSTAT